MRIQANNINAGSMADIAFLLLVFFLLVTKIDDDWGIESRLPAYVEDLEPTRVSERNILEIELTDVGEIYVEGSMAAVLALREGVRAFYLNSGILSPKASEGDFPIRREASISEARELLRNEPSPSAQQIQLLEMYEKFGDCLQLPENAVISLKTGDECSYDRYIQVLDIINSEIAQMRDELALKTYGMPIDRMQENNLDDACRVIQVLIPTRIVEPEGD